MPGSLEALQDWPDSWLWLFCFHHRQYDPLSASYEFTFQDVQVFTLSSRRACSSLPRSGVNVQKHEREHTGGNNAGGEVIAVHRIGRVRLHMCMLFLRGYAAMSHSEAYDTSAPILSTMHRLCSRRSLGAGWFWRLTLMMRYLGLGYGGS